MLLTRGVGWFRPGCGPVDGLKLDRGEPAEAGLPAPTAVGALDPGHDHQLQVLAGLPALPVENVRLQQGEGRFQRGVVAAGVGASARQRPGLAPRPPPAARHRPNCTASVTLWPRRSTPERSGFKFGAQALRSAMNIPSITDLLGHPNGVRSLQVLRRHPRVATDANPTLADLMNNNAPTDGLGAKGTGRERG